MTYISAIRAKLVTPEAAARVVKSGDYVDYGFGASYPTLLDRALAARRDELRDVKVRGGLVIGDRIEIAECDPEQEAFRYLSWHIGDTERKLQARGLAEYIPVILRYLPYFYRRSIRTDVAFVPVSEPDDAAYMGLGVSNYAWRTIIENSHTVIFEINEHLPTLQGADGSHRVHISECDYITCGEHEPLPQRLYPAPEPEDELIAEHVVSLLTDGASLSLGVGSVPYAVAKKIADSDLKDIGCHTGTLSDAFLALHQAGKLTGSRKELLPGRAVWNLAMGSSSLYEWLANSPELFCPHDLDFVHDPARIAGLSNAVSINGGVQIDLLGQENGESAGYRQLSGTGGQLDFLEGAFRSPGGKGFICLHAAHKKKDGSLESNILPCFAPGSVVSAPRAFTQYVVTEYGARDLSALTRKERALALIEIAHPKFRSWLEDEAKASGLI